MDNDSLKNALPPDWSYGVMQDGRIFFINDKENQTTWLHPDTGEAVRTGHFKRHDLPIGWEQAFNKDGAYYINHNNKTTGLKLPEHLTANVNMNNSKMKQLQGDDERNRKSKKKRTPSFKAAFSPKKSLFRRSSSKSKTIINKENQRQDNSISRPASARNGSSKIKVVVRRRNPHSEVTKYGWLYKQDSSGKMKMWRKRWFVLADFCLFYYKDTKEDEVLGSIVMPSYKIETINSNDKINRKYAFKVEHSGMRTYYFSADSYNDMAEWITFLRRASIPHSPEKKHHMDDSKKSSIKKKAIKQDENSDSEFGFNQYKPSSVSSTASSCNASEDKKDSPEMNTKHHDKVVHGNNVTSPRYREVPMKQPKRHEYVNTPNHHPDDKHVPEKAHEYVNQDSSTRLSPKQTVTKSQTRKPPIKRENGESAYYSDTSGATENSRNYAKRDKQSTQQTTHANQPHGNQPHLHGNQEPKSPIKRNNSLAKINEWASSREQKSSPTKNKSSTMHNGYRSHHKGRRYRQQTYNEYMDPMEVASSIMSMPPIQQSARARTLPRPRSSENINKPTERKHVAPAKSVGNIIKEPQTNNGNYDIKRSKSDYVHDKGNRKTTSGSDSTTPRSQKHSPYTPQSTPRYDDVFSPRSELSAIETHKNQVFNYRDTVDAQPIRTNRIHRKDVAPETKRPINDRLSKHKDNKYEVKQVTKGQLRAFVISSRDAAQQVASTQGSLPPSHNDKGIEAKLYRLDNLELSLNKVSSEIAKLQEDKERLEDALVIAKSRLESEWNSRNRESSRELSREQKQLEHDLYTVNVHLSNAAHKLHQMAAENEMFETEVKNLKSKLLDDLDKQRNPEVQKDLVWQVDRLEFMMKGLKRNKQNIEDKYHLLRNKKHEEDDILSITHKAPSSTLSYRSDGKSPRDVKRTSYERRNPRSTSQGDKYFTLPGHGVSHAKSVDSLTAASITSGSPRPLSARSYSTLHSGGAAALTRTKSAAERLFQGSQQNVASFDKEANDIKRIQREINRNRRQTLNTTATTSPRRQTYGSSLKGRIGTDVQQAMRLHKMPKVLKRANRDQARAETEKQSMNFPPTLTDESSSRHREADLEPEKDNSMELLAHEMLAPEKVYIPERLMEFDFNDGGLNERQIEMKENKVKSIERVLARSGQQASMAAVHMAAALSVEAGSAARAVAHQAMEHEHPQQQPQYSNGFIV